MPPKPQRLLFGRVSDYADEASAYMRRRRIRRQPFARVYEPGGASAAFSSDTAEGRELFRAAAHLIGVAGAAPEDR